MTEIPDDVMKAARKVVIEDLGIDIPGSLKAAHIDCVAEAIMAERERCAKVAYAYANAHTSEHKMIGHIIGRKILFDKVDDGS